MPHDHHAEGCRDHGHGHGHAHGHGHGHGHAHGPARHDRAFAIGIGLNSVLVAAQLGFGLAASSMALLSDAVHNLGDVLGLALAWAAAVLGRRGPLPRRTYGWGRTSILAAMANAMLLLVSLGAIGLEAVRRLAHPVPVSAHTVAWVAGIGLVVNGATALLFLRGREGDLNLRGAFQHMAADAALSAGVLMSALIVAATGFVRLDALASLAIGGVIAWGSWGLLRESLDLALDAVPAGVSEASVAGFLGAMEGVAEVHDLHIWPLSTTETAVTAHLVIEGAGDGPGLVQRAASELRARFGIAHSTLQVETASVAESCALRPAETV